MPKAGAAHLPTRRWLRAIPIAPLLFAFAQYPEGTARKSPPPEDALPARPLEPAGPAVAELNPRWSSEAHWQTAIPSSDRASIWALSYGWLVEFDSAGAVTSRQNTPARGHILRLAMLDPGDDPEFIVASTWSESLSAIDHEGAVLWTAEIGDAINDVQPLPATENGPGGIVVACIDGLYVLDAEGRAVWQDRTLSPCFSVCIMDFAEKGEPSIVAAQGATLPFQGVLRILSADGKEQRSIKVPISANRVWAVPAGNDGPGTALLVAGRNKQSLYSVLRLSTHGDAVAEPTLLTNDRNDYVVCGDVSDDGRLAAFGMRSGRVLVIDLLAGVVIAQTDDPWFAWGIGWLGDQQSRFLIVAAVPKLIAYAIETPPAN